MSQRVLDAAALRDSNLVKVYHAVAEESGVTRAELASRLEMSRSTASSLVQTLLDLQVLREDGQASSKGGRRATKLRVSEEQWFVLGTDLGATHVGTALMTLTGEIRATRAKTMDVRSSPKHALEEVVQQCEELMRGAGIENSRVIGLGVAVPSPVSPMRPGFVSDSIMPRWAEVDIVDRLSQALGLRVLLGNDANMGGLAESLWGIGQSASSLAYIKVGTGVGCGLIMDGRIHQGVWGFAGELGHLLMRDNAGQPQSLNDMVGKEPLEAHYVKLRDELGKPPRNTISGNSTALLAQQGDPIACAVIAEAGRMVGRAVTNLIHLLNPEMVILGGSLAMAGDLLLRPVQDEVHQLCGWHSLKATRVSLGQLGERGVVAGAAGAVLHAFENDIRAWLEPKTTDLAMASGG